MDKSKNSRLPIVVIAIFIATFMASVEITIVTTALPTIISKLNGLALQSWVFAMYLLTTAVSTPIYGKISDRVGRKPIFIIGLAVFSLGSFLSGIAGNIYFLILFRAIQGIGAGAVMPMTFAIIADLFVYEKRSNMIALNNTAWGISALLGPLLGGFIVDKLNWHWIFFINVPLGIIVILLTLFGLKEQHKEVKKFPIDFEGIISLTGTLSSLLVLLQSLGESTLTLPLILISGLLFIGFLIWFIIAEKRAVDPVIPLQLFKNQLFTIQILTVLLANGMQISFQLYFPIWLQSIYKVSSSVAGLAVTPSPVLWLVGSFFVGALVKKFAPRNITLPIIFIQMLFYLPLVWAGMSFPMFMFYVIAGVTGAGLGIIITMNTLITQEIVADDQVGTASSMLTLGRNLGQTIMTGIFGLLFNVTINRSITKYPQINFNEMNKFISSSQQVRFSHIITDDMGKVILNGMHAVFAAVIVLFIVILALNFYDKNHSVVK